MALTNYEKQKRWREKNRALYNLQQRNRRVVKKGFVLGEAESRGQEREETGYVPVTDKSKAIEALRGLVAAESAKPVEANVVTLVYRDDYGRVISERQWKALQERKERARSGGYEIDDYSQ